MQAPRDTHLPREFDMSLECTEDLGDLQYMQNVNVDEAQRIDEQRCLLWYSGPMPEIDYLYQEVSQ